MSKGVWYIACTKKKGGGNRIQIKIKQILKASAKYLVLKFAFTN